MSEPAVFEICFPAHITRIPVCRPGETIAGVVVLKLKTPLVASHLLLRFCGAERVRRSPVAVRTELTEKKQQQTAMLQKMVMDKEFFRRELVLWGEPKQSSMKIIPCDSVHRFHFSFTMPYVNMPTPRQTPDIEISYSLEASLFSEVFDQQRGEKVLRDIHKTSSKCFRFEPVVQQLVNYNSAVSLPYESVLQMNEAVANTSESKSGSMPLSSISLLNFQSSKKPVINLNVFQSNSAYLPGETVELLVLAPAGKKITNASFQLRENVRCRKSSAPIIDESDVPVLWKYSVDLLPPQEIVFNKLSKSSVTQDIGMLGRFVFTSHTGTAQGARIAEAAVVSSPMPPQSTHSSSDSSSVSTGESATRNLKLKAEEGLAISNIATTRQHMSQRPGVPLSPLTESQEVGTGNSISTSDAPEGEMSSQGPPLSSHHVRGRTGSLGTIQPQQMYSAGYTPASSTSPQPRARPIIAASVSAPYHTPSVGALGSRMSKTISPNDIEDNVSDRSSISDTLSIRYQPTKTSQSTNLSSLTRGASTNNGAKYTSRTGVTPVALGDLLAKGSYKFAKIQFTLPPITEMSPVSSVYLDFEYTVDIAMTIGSNFGTSKKAAGRLPLKMVTVRTAAKASDSGAVEDGASQALSDPAESMRSLRDSLSCLNLSIAHSDEAVNASHKSNASPANTLTEIHFEGPGGGVHDGKLSNGCYPCLLSFIQNGEKIPMPELESINIGPHAM
ncbi:hypothetical protein EV183_002696 [Coemansia sp. RSA 2336]|nr:hypothetical protein EV183_002696 [Coemansia sp. RSA 2336]